MILSPENTYFSGMWRIRCSYARLRDPQIGREKTVVVLASLLPDAIDKPVA